MICLYQRKDLGGVNVHNSQALHMQGKKREGTVAENGA
jgi:hypothetical protein